MSETRSSRRGALAIGAAKAWFLVVGLAQNVLLPIVIGQASFGTYKRALAFVNVLNNLIVVASIQAVSRAVSSTPAKRTAMRRATSLHALMGLVLALLFSASVPGIVAHQHAPQLARPLHAMAAVLFAYSAYAALVGALNGTRSFGAQAGLDALYSTLRTAGLLAGGWYFAHQYADGAFGASLGFVAAACAIVPIALFATRTVHDEGDGAFDTRAHLSFLVGLLAMQGFQSLLLQVDLMVLGRAATLRAMDFGAAESDARATADRVSGLYAQAQAFGLVPYQLLLAAGFVMFPTISAAHARGDQEAVRAEIAKGGAAALLVAGGLAAAVGGAPMGVLRFAFGHGTADALPLELAAPTLRFLAIAHAATAIAALGTTMVAATGRGRLAATLAGLVALAATAGASIGARLGGDPLHMGAHVAAGLAVGIVAGASVVAVVVARSIGARYVRPLSLARVAVALAVALVVGARVPIAEHRMLAVLAPVVPLAIYLVVVALLGQPVRIWLGGRGSPPGNARPP